MDKYYPNLEIWKENTREKLIYKGENSMTFGTLQSFGGHQTLRYMKETLRPHAFTSFGWGRRGTFNRSSALLYSGYSNIKIHLSHQHSTMRYPTHPQMYNCTCLCFNSPTNKKTNKLKLVYNEHLEAITICTIEYVVKSVLKILIAY